MPLSSQLALPLIDLGSDGFDLSAELGRLVADITRVAPCFAHIDPARIGIGCTQARSRSRFGRFASIYPLRFAGGATCERRGRSVWHSPRVILDGRELLYLMLFYVPRYFTLDPQKRLGVVFHELFHIDEAFDGDLRRFEGHYSYHGRSVREYETRFAADMAAYIASGRPRRFQTLLEAPLSRIVRRYGGATWIRFPQPQLLREPTTCEIGSAERRGRIDPPPPLRDGIHAIALTPQVTRYDGVTP